MDNELGPVDRGKGFKVAMKCTIVVATLLLAISLPARYVVAWREPVYASMVGLPWLRTLPTSTVCVATITVAVQSVLMILVVREIWRITERFYSGEFFSRSVSTMMRRASFILFGVTATGILGIAIGLASVSYVRGYFPPLGLVMALLNMPSGACVCGLLSYAVARAFDRATRMAEEARFTV
ncbi:hypothetical protein [Sphingomonas sp. YL-JM2C]